MPVVKHFKKSEITDGLHNFDFDDAYKPEKTFDDQLTKAIPEMPMQPVKAHPTSIEDMVAKLLPAVLQSVRGQHNSDIMNIDHQADNTPTNPILAKRNEIPTAPNHKGKAPPTKKPFTPTSHHSSLKPKLPSQRPSSHAPKHQPTAHPTHHHTTPQHTHHHTTPHHKTTPHHTPPHHTPHHTTPHHSTQHHTKPHTQHHTTPKPHHTTPKPHHTTPKPHHSTPRAPTLHAPKPDHKAPITPVPPFVVQPHTARQLRILCFGDSLTAGYNKHGKNFYPYCQRLQQILNYRSQIPVFTDTKGIVGEMTHKQMTTRLPLVLGNATKKMSGAFDWVCILGGTNDILHVKNFADDQEFLNQLETVWQPRITKDIETLHKTAWKMNSHTLLLTVPENSIEGWPDYKPLLKMRQRINEALRVFAAESKGKAVLCDLARKLPRHTLGPRDEALYWDDHLHMTPEGYNKMAGIVADCLKPYLPHYATW